MGSLGFGFRVKGFGLQVLGGGFEGSCMERQGLPLRECSATKKRGIRPPFAGPRFVLALSGIRRLAVTSRQVEQTIWFWVWSRTGFPSFGGRDIRDEIAQMVVVYILHTVLLKRTI